MSNNRRVVKVFLASPGDLAPERKIVKDVIDEINAIQADFTGYHIDLVGWEDTVSVFGRPQATINQQLERCEYFIGLMWKRWGTAPAVGGAYTSGFEEEFRLSVDRRAKERRPEISLFFKEVDQASLQDPGDELKKVQKFQQELIERKEILFERFSTSDDLEKKVRRCIHTYIQRLKTEEEMVGNEGSSPKPSFSSIPEMDSPSLQAHFSAEGARFLREYISKVEGANGADAISAVDTARFRLLAMMMGREENDDSSLGVHDANLLYFSPSHTAYGRREKLGILYSGLEHFSDENVPIWKWVNSLRKETPDILSLCTLLGSTHRRISAINAMSIISESIDKLESMTREEILSEWMSHESSDLRVAALKFIKDSGLSSDVELIKKEFERRDSKTAQAASEAIICIRLRDGRQHAARALYDLQPTTTNKKILDSLFDRCHAIDDSLLYEGLSHADPEVRRRVMRCLRSKGVLTEDKAEALLADGDLEVRFEAISYLMDAGRQFSEEEIQKCLSDINAVGLGSSVFGLTDSRVTTMQNRLRRNRLALLSTPDLESASRAATDMDQSAYLTLLERTFSKRGNELRALVDDQFKEFSLGIAARRSWAGGLGFDYSKFMIENLQKNLTRRGIDIICRHQDARDIQRIRNSLRVGFISPSPLEMEFVAKHGEWEDIGLIVSAVKRGSGFKLALLASDVSPGIYPAAAAAMYELGRGRVGELVQLDVPNALLTELMAIIPDKAFCELPNELLIKRLLAGRGQARKVVALKCIKALPKGRLMDLLAEYTSSTDSWYYNVIHWLDLGVSLPQEAARKAAARALADLAAT